MVWLDHVRKGAADHLSPQPSTRLFAPLPPTPFGRSPVSHSISAEPPTAPSATPLLSNHRHLANVYPCIIPTAPSAPCHGGLPPMSVPLPSELTTDGLPIGSAAAPYAPAPPTKPGAASHQPTHDDDAFQQSWLVRLWNRRHQCAAMVVSLFFFMGGLAVALVLFFWFRGVHRSYYSNDLQRTCLSLGDSLALDISTNLVTFADDMAGYAATEPNLNNATMAQFTSLAASHAEETDGVSLAAVLPRHRQSEWEQQFNLTLIDGNDTFTKLSLVAPITHRIAFPPLRNPVKNPIGYNMFQSGEYARSVRRTLGNSRPSLVVAEPASTQMHHPSKRVWIAKGAQEVPVPNFHIWIITLLVDTQRAVARTLAPSDRTHGIHVRLVDNATASELYVSQSPADSTLIPSDTAVTSFPVVDRNWTLTCTGTHTLRGAFYTPWSWVLLFLLLVVFTVSAELARRAMVRFLTARGIARQVKHREGLVASLRMYSRAIVLTVRDPLIALDPFGYLVGSNKEALARLGIHGSNTSTVHISSLLPPEFVTTVMAANARPELGVLPSSPAIPPMSNDEWDSVYSFSDSGRESNPPQALEPLPAGSYEVGTVGTQSSTFIAEATVSQPTAAKRGEVSQVLLLHDVTERIQALESLQAAKDAAKAASVAKSQLLLLISHELRNPIYVVGTLVDEVAEASAAAVSEAPIGGDGTGAHMAADDSEYVAAARVQHTTRLIADILGNLVDLFADSTALEEAARLAAATAAGASKSARPKGPGKKLVALANTALTSVHPLLDMWDIGVEPWISPEWVLYGSTETVERILAKVAYIVAHATRPCGQSVLELLVDKRNRELRVYCRGDMWIPAENSLQFMAAAPRTPPPLVPSSALGVPQEQPFTWQADKIPTPEHIDPLTQAALFLAMGSVCAVVLPMHGSVLRTQFSEQYGGLDLSIPLGLMRAARVRRVAASEEGAQTASPATAPEAEDAFSEQVVSIPSIPLPEMATPSRPAVQPLSATFGSPPRNLAPSPVAYPSPISPDRAPLLPQPSSEHHQSVDLVAATSKCDAGDHHHALFTPTHSRAPSLSMSTSFPPSPSSAPRTPNAFSPCPPPLNSRRASRMATLMAVRTMAPHSPSPPASTVPSAPPSLHRVASANTVIVSTFPGSKELSSNHPSDTVPLDPRPSAPSTDTLPFDIPLPSSPAPSTKSFRISTPAATPPRLILARVATPSMTPMPATLEVFPLIRPPIGAASIVFAPTSQVHIDGQNVTDPPPHISPTHTMSAPQSAALPVASHRPAKQQPPTAPGLKRILIVEDNALVLRVTSKLVKTLGYEADTATDGLECIKRMNDKSKPKVDLLLMDLVMPNLDGHEAMKALRDGGFSKDFLPVIAVTANALPEEREKCLAAGFNEFVTKPLKKDGLVDICRRFISEVVD